MSWHARQLRAIGVEPPKIFVETGAYRGNGIQDALTSNDYEHVHSIELSPKWASYCIERFKDNPKVTVHWGDSATVLERLFKESALPEVPILFYLDAHWSGGETDGLSVDGGCPVIRELEVIKKYRKSDGDVIIIDDMRLMGKASWSGSHNDRMYPRTYFDWSHVQQDHMLEIFPHKRIFESQNPDRLIIY